MLGLAAVLLTAAGFPLAAQPDSCCSRSSATELAPPALAGKLVTMDGTVGQIHIVAGQGMPHFELKRSADTLAVYLGPMPFLIAVNFNPKTGQKVTVKGYQMGESIVAAEVTFSAEKRTIRFRDERGWPVWRGHHGSGQRHE